MTPQKLQKLGIRAALIALLVSSALFFAYYFTAFNAIVYLEYLFIFIIVAVSFVLILRILNHTAKHQRYKKPLWATAGFLFFSMLVALVFFRLMTNLMDTMRINFVNNAGHEIHDVKVTGCQKKRLGTLQAGAAQTIWIRVKRDCSITVSYRDNGQVKSEVVSAYVTTSMGQKLTFTLGR